MQLAVYSGFCLKYSWEWYQLLQNNNAVEIAVESLFRKGGNGSIAPWALGEKSYNHISHFLWEGSVSRL